MIIDNIFTIGLSAEDAWPVLRDLERIAPCMPGAELQEITDDEFRGVVKVKLGAVTAQYKGAVRIIEVDETHRRLVLKAEGLETQGQGNASATVTATLRGAGERRTEVVISTDLIISGKISQFGRSVLADVSTKLLADFARCLETDLLASPAPTTSASQPASAPATGPASTGPEATTSEIVADEIADMAVDDPERAARFVAAVTPPTAVAPSPGSPPIQSREAEPVDLVAIAGPTVAKRAFPAAIVGVLVLQGLVKGRVKRLGLAAVGAALVAALVGGNQ